MCECRHPLHGSQPHHGGSGFQSQERRTMPKNVQAIVQLRSFHMLEEGNAQNPSY